MHIGLGNPQGSGFGHAMGGGDGGNGLDCNICKKFATNIGYIDMGMSSGMMLRIVVNSKKQKQLKSC